MHQLSLPQHSTIAQLDGVGGLLGDGVVVVEDGEGSLVLLQLRAGAPLPASAQRLEAAGHRHDLCLLQERYPEQLVKGRIDEDWRMSEKKEVAMALRGEEDGLTTTLAAEEEGERRRTRIKRNDRDETNEVAKLASESTEPRRGLREDGAWFSHDLDIGKPDPPT